MPTEIQFEPYFYTLPSTHHEVAGIAMGFGATIAPLLRVYNPIPCDRLTAPAEFKEDEMLPYNSCLTVLVRVNDLNDRAVATESIHVYNAHGNTGLQVFSCVVEVDYDMRDN